MNRFMFPFFFLAMFASWPMKGYGQEPKVINLEKVNTAKDEVDPFVNADGLTLYYATNTAGTFDIVVSRRTSKVGPWGAGKPLPGLNSKDADERSPFVYAKEAALYFATNAVPDEKLKGLQNLDIKKRIGERAPLILPGISEKEDELHPRLAALGKEFYFSRKTEEGWLLMVANGPSPGPVGKAKPVGFPPGFHAASLTNTGLLMVLQGPLDKNRWGLFVSRRTKVNAPWSKPEPLSQLNHAEGEQGAMTPFITGDGLRLFFASDRPDGKGGLDLWMVMFKDLKLEFK